MSMKDVAIAATVAGVGAYMLKLLRFRGSPSHTLNELGNNVDVKPLSEDEKKAIAHAKSLLEPKDIPILTNPTPRFHVNDSGWLDYLDTHGYAVIKSVASEQEIEHAKDLLWEFLESTSEMRRDDPSTWHSFRGCNQTGIMFRDGIGHSRFLWFLRCLPDVISTFTQIWHTPDLLTSFDGGNLFRPWTPDELDWKTRGGWYHVDQGRLKQGLQAVQGLVSLYPATPHTGGLVVVPGSHRHHPELTANVMGKRDFVRIKTSNPLLVNPTLVTCSAGDLVLWDSRTIHCNSPALLPPTTASSAPDLVRAVGYVCMTPASKANEEVLEKRREAYENGTSTSHWPHEFHPSSEPTTQPTPLCRASPLVRSLVGVS